MRTAHAFALLLCAALAACEKRPPDEFARLLERSAARWEHVTRGEWAESYDYLSPTVRGWLTLDRFLEGKRRHAFKDPGRPELLGLDSDGDVAFVRVNLKWTNTSPTCWDPPPELSEPSDSLWQGRLDVVETWEWRDGDWWMRWPMARPSDFFADHPELLRARAGTQAQ